MQYGVCGGPEIAAPAADAGFDYFEASVGGLLKPLENEAAFKETLAKAKSAPLPCPVVNCFVPGDLKITGPRADLAALKKYVTTVFQRAKEARVEVIVFGSGGARNVPDGFDREKARDQIAAFCRMFAPIAGKHGVTVVAEPLNKAECNILTTVAEAAELVRKVNHPSFRLLVDGYHWAKDGDSVEDVVSNGSLLRHVHVATTQKRLAPAAEECDLAPFFNALGKAGYNGRISIEGGIPNPGHDLPKALAAMKGLAR